MSADIFISYKSEEEAVARRVRQVLEENGFSCWMAPDSIPSGSNYMKQIPQAIDSCKAMIVLVSEKSQHSVWVKNEFSQAVTKEKPVIPLVIQNCELEDEFRFSMSTMQQVHAWQNEEEALKKVVRDLRSMLGKDGGEIRITVRKKPDYRPVIAALIAVAAVIAGLVFFLNRPASRTENKPAETTGPEVYHSEILPYFMAGSFSTAEEAASFGGEITSFPKAVSLLAFLRNPKEEPAFAEKISAKIQNLVPDQTADILLDGVMIDGRVRFFAYNNGWGDSDDVHVRWRMIPGDAVPEFSALDAVRNGSETVRVKSGEASPVMDARIDFTEILNWARNNQIPEYQTIFSLLAETDYDGRPSSAAIMFSFDRETDSIVGLYGGANDEVLETTLHAFLDVDNPPEELRFYSRETPVLRGIGKIETVIIPTKSCSFTVSGNYLIGGNEFHTEPYDVSVRVPYFNSAALTAGGQLTRALFELPAEDTASMRKMCRQYQYDVFSILPADAPVG